VIVMRTLVPCREGTRTSAGIVTSEDVMMEPWSGQTSHPQSASEFIAVMEKAVRCMDEMLGYRGPDRFVMFYYEPRGEEVVWRDSASYGFATGAWSTFLTEVGPVADHYQADVGCNGVPAREVLLVDRRDRRAYFAERNEAIQFLAAIAGEHRRDGFVNQANPKSKVPTAMVEITHEAITQLAHAIWERKGCPQGQDVQDWLEAEATLKTHLTTSA